jgi:hypothetical protein
VWEATCNRSIIRSSPASHQSPLSSICIHLRDLSILCRDTLVHHDLISDINAREGTRAILVIAANLGSQEVTMSEQPPKDFCITVVSEGATSVIYTNAPFTMSIIRNGVTHAPSSNDKSAGFLTSYHVVLRSTGKPNDRVSVLIIDDGKPIALNTREFILLKALAQQMLDDQNKLPEDMGWIESATLKGDGVKAASFQRSGEIESDDPNGHTKAIHAIRNKLRRLHLSEDLIEYKRHSYRLSTAPVNIKIDSV